MVMGLKGSGAELITALVDHLLNGYGSELITAIGYHHLNGYGSEFLSARLYNAKTGDGEGGVKTGKERKDEAKWEWQ